jgi:hypothetical protein
MTNRLAAEPTQHEVSEILIMSDRAAHVTGTSNPPHYSASRS